MEELVDYNKRIFKREIIFGNAPLIGLFKYKDIFQIFPADMIGMPTTKVAHKHYPIILEYWYTQRDLDNIKVDENFEEIEDLHRLTSLSYRKKELYIGLLSLITTNLFFTYSSSDSRWGFPYDETVPGSEVNKMSSKWCFEWFIWPELSSQLKINQFTLLNIAHQNSIPWKQYFQFDPNLDWRMDGTPISFPDIATLFLDAYFEKEVLIKRTLDSAISSANASMEFMSSKKKLSILSSFTSIETMVNLETAGFNSSKCQTCGQEMFKISARFRDFLLKYIGDSKKNKLKFNSYYALRSKIVHTGQEFKIEKLFTDVDEDVKSQEHLQIAEIVILSKMAIILWTLKTSSFYSDQMI